MKKHSDFPSGSGFREIEHIADWELEVWAPDLPGLLEQAARGMYALVNIQMQNGDSQECRLELEATDSEHLLVRFLSELLYFADQAQLAFNGFDLEIDGEKLIAHLSGAPIISRGKEIKAVTYHNLQVRKSQRGLEACVVFDV